jgi:hypothetical protein
MKIPPCPWPEKVWTMTIEEYVKAVPDNALRTRISGLLMREGWNLCVEEILRANKEDND